MSATLQEHRRPAAGDRVTASVAHGDTKAKLMSVTLPDGSIVLTKEELAILGDGDASVGAREIRLMIANERDRTINEAECPRSKSASVRYGLPSDRQAIIDLLLLDVEENAAIVAPPNLECIEETVDQALKRPNVTGVIEGPDGKLVAVVMLIATRWWWAKSFYYQEIPLFVHPDHRKSTHARSLMNFQKFWVDEMTKEFGYRVHLLCGVLGTVKVRAKTALYRRLYRQVGSVFLYPWITNKGGWS